MEEPRKTKATPTKAEQKHPNQPIALQQITIYTALKTAKHRSCTSTENCLTLRTDALKKYRKRSCLNPLKTMGRPHKDNGNRHKSRARASKPPQKQTIAKRSNHPIAKCSNHPKTRISTSAANQSIALEQTTISRKLEFSSWSFLCFKAKYVLGWLLCLFA